MALVFCVAVPLAGRASIWREEWLKALNEATVTGTCEDVLQQLERGKQSTYYRLGMVLAALSLSKGACGPKNVALAIKLYRKAAMLGNTTAKVHLGQSYFLGADVPRDAGEARYWFRGAVLSVFSYREDRQLDAVIEQTVTESVKVRVKEELDWMRSLAASGPRKRMKIARKLIDGDGVPPDPDAAKAWIESAADDGLPAAMLIHAQWMIDGRVQEFSKGDGVDLLLKTAKRDYVPAMNELARRLEFGDGMERDDVSAYIWLLRAGWRGAATGDALQRVGGFLTAKEKKSAAEIARAPYL